MKDRQTKTHSRGTLGETGNSSADLFSISLSGKDASKWKLYSTAFYTRIRNLFDAVVSLDTFRRRSVGKELNRMLHAAIESTHAILDLPAAKNAQIRAEAKAALAKAELDRVRASAERSTTDEGDLEEKRARHSAANRKIQRMIARGELTVYENQGEVIIIYSAKAATENLSNDDQQ